MNKFVNFGARPLYFFSSVAKKKQMELTLRTPYSILPLIQKLFSTTSPASPGSLPNLKTPLLSSKTELQEPCMSFLLAPSVSSSLKSRPILQANSSTLGDG